MHRDARRTFAWHRQEHNYPVLSKPYFMRRPERKHKKKKGGGIGGGGAMAVCSQLFLFKSEL